MSAPRHRLTSSLTARQVRALVGLRWRMVRRPWARVGLVALAACLPVVLALAVAVGVQLRAANDALGPAAGPAGILPASLFASMLVLAVLAPLAAGGAHELYPGEQLVAFPVRPATAVTSSLLLTPLNLAWLTQVLGILGATGYVAGAGPGLPLAVTATVVYVVFASVAGQALAWTVVALRHSAAGRTAVAAATGACCGAVLALSWNHRGTAALESFPSSRVLDLVRDVGATPAGAVETWTSGHPIFEQGAVGHWVLGVAALVLGTLVAARLAVPACHRAMSRAPDRAVHSEGRNVRRRRARGSVLAELTAVDRASVARSAPLRRGVLVLAALPGLAAAVPSVEWTSIVMLPGLVSAGTGLLFGVNVFCLDGGGAVWLASLPHDPRLAYLAKARVLAEVCVGTALVTVAVAAVRAPTTPTAAQLCAVVGAGFACPAAVVAACMRMSVRHPHRAELRSSRDTPAPPGSMVAYSLRLSAVATLTAGVMSVFSYAENPWTPLLAALGLTLRPALSIARSAMLWRSPEPRARVVAAVSAG